MDIHTQSTWTPILAKELSTGLSVTDGGKVGLPESKPKQIQNLMLWIVLWENLPS